MSTIYPLEERVLPDDCFVFKHSTACPVSARAAEEVKRAKFSLPLYWINVIEERPMSNWFAEHFTVTHHSPQLSLIRHGKVEQTWSYGEIQAAVLEQQN